MPQQEYKGTKTSPSPLSAGEIEISNQVHCWYKDYTRGLGLGSHPNYMPVSKKRALRKLLYDYSAYNKEYQKQPFYMQLRNAWKDGWIEEKIDTYLLKHESPALLNNDNN